MFGLLVWLAVAAAMGTVVGYLLGLGHLGPRWHTGIGAAGQLLGWGLLVLLPLPYWIRMTVNRVDIFPIWGTIGTLMVGLVVAILQPDRGDGGSDRAG